MFEFFLWRVLAGPVFPFFSCHFKIAGVVPCYLISRSSMIGRINKLAVHHRSDEIFVVHIAVGILMSREKLLNLQ